MNAKLAGRFLRPTLVELETRDVPALFFVDPLLAGKGGGAVVTFNENGPGAVAGLTFGTDAFATLNDALTAAAANAEADTIRLARSRDAGGFPNVTPLDNSAGGTITINDDITLIGSGRGATVLNPTTDAAGGVFTVAPGKSFTVRDLTFDGTGRLLSSAFRFDGAGVVGKVDRVEVTNVSRGDLLAAGIVGINGADLTVVDSQVSGYERIGISFADATGSVSGSTITGRGAGSTFLNYGVQIAGQSTVAVTGSTITGNTASTGGFLSVGVNIFEFGGNAPTATITKSTITGNTLGIEVGGNYLVDKSVAFVHQNNLNDNYIAVQADNDNTVDATDNWWGDASGPFQVTTNTGGKGAEVTDQVTYSPWLTSPYVNQAPPLPPVVIMPPPTPPVVVTVPQPVPVPVFTITQTVPTPQKVVPTIPGGLIAGSTGGGAATALNATLGPDTSSRPFGGRFTGEVRVARGDVNGDGTPDMIAAAGTGGDARVQVFDGVSGALIRDFYAYATGFTGGAFVASGDIDGDGFADIVTGAGGGGGTHIKAFSGRDGSLIRSFFAYDPKFLGGVTVAVGDVNGDGSPDIVTGATAGGGPHVQVFSGKDGSVLRSFYAFDRGFTGGVFVSAGDLTGGGFADVVVGAGVGGGPNVRVFGGQTGELTRSFLAAEGGFNGGVRVGAQDLDNDGRKDLLFGLGAGADNRVRVTYASNLNSGNTSPTAFSQPLFDNNNGLYVG